MTQSTNDSERILEDAVARNLGITLRLPSAGLDKHFKTRFLGAAEGGGIWVEVVAGYAESIKSLIAEQRPIDVSLQTSTRVISFAVKGVRFEESHCINADTVVAALLIEQPAEIKNVQRRNTYRVRIFSDFKLIAKIWIIPEHVHLNDRPVASSELKFQLVDVSIGGIGLRMPAPAEGEKQIRVIKDQRLRIELTFNEQKLLFEGRFRPASLTASGGILTAGVVFKNLESNMEGRQKLAVLTKIVGELQREEVRRARVA
jgi:c-di-GMP-binding flagellar brake protein YcgR